MKTTADRLPGLLKKHIAPIYLISSDEPCLQQETADLIRVATQQAGYTERHILTVTPQFDWYRLRAETAALSLFSRQRFFELRFPSGKPGDMGSKTLQAYAAAPPADTVLLILTDKLAPATLNSTWYKALDRVGVTLTIWPITATEFPKILNERLRATGLSTDADGLALLTDFLQGNLFAATQEIAKLHLLYGNTSLSKTQIAAALADVARFDVFQLADHLLRGNAGAALRVLQGLREEDTAPTLILWAITRELRQWLQWRVARETETPVKLHAKQQTLYQAARQTLKHAERCLSQAHEVDRTIKGITPGNPWDHLAQLCLFITGHSHHAA